MTPVTDVRHVLGISGGKDSAALAIYLRTRFPEMNVEYYFMDTGKELDETYEFIDNLEVFLGKKIDRRHAAKGSPVSPFDHYLETYGGYLPSPNARWCTRKLKLEPFERDYIREDLALSYVAIRADEDREGFISHKPNIQTLFPFRRNIWTQDVMSFVFAPEQAGRLGEVYSEVCPAPLRDTVIEIVGRAVGARFSLQRKVNTLLDLGVPLFNHAVFAFLRHSKFPIANLDVYPLLDKEDTVDRNGVFRLLEDSGVGKPKYYEPIEIAVNGTKGFYNRSRSGCFFCFFQQKIEWVWLYEQHPGRFQEAMDYEKDGFTWMDDERLAELIQPGRIEEIKKVYFMTPEGEDRMTWEKLAVATGASMDYDTVMYPYIEGDVLQTVYINMDSSVIKNYRTKLKTHEQYQIADRRYVSSVYFHLLFLYAINKQRGYQISKTEQGEEDQTIDLADYLKDIFSSNYAAFLLGFGMEELVEALG